MQQVPTKTIKRHGRDNFLVRGEGILAGDDQGQPVVISPTQEAEQRKFLFSRLGPKGAGLGDALLEKIAIAMVPQGAQADADVAAGHTYLGQFVDHDMTFDRTAASFGSMVTLDDLVQGRTPALDLDSLYGRGPLHPESEGFYRDGVRLKLGSTHPVPNLPPDGRANLSLDGHDLPRSGLGSLRSERRKAMIPDHRNDENLAVAQTHLAFMHFHNAVADKLASQGTPSTTLFETARELVVKHYQWMLVHEYLPAIADAKVVEDVFASGRKFFEVDVPEGDMPTMPLEFAVAAFRQGHSMVRASYEWNRVFMTGGFAVAGSLFLLFLFSGTSGTLDPAGQINDPESGTIEKLPTNWPIDWRRFFDFKPLKFKAPQGGVNMAHPIDTLLVDPLGTLPLGSFGGHGSNPPAIQMNLAFRNLVRARMVELASGQQMATMLGEKALTKAEIIGGKGGADLSGLSKAEQDEVAADTPLWFYVLREAEVHGKGKLTRVGARIVAEVFHRAIGGSAHSIVRDPTWRPSLGTRGDTFEMIDLLNFAFGGNEQKLNPMGN